MKKIALLSALMFGCALQSGRQLWLHPEKFIYRTGEMVNIRFMTGENYEGENWNGNRMQVESFRLYYADVMDDCTDQLSETDKGDSVQVSFFEEGTMMFAFNHRKDSTGSEHHHRSIKTLVQVGSKLTSTYKKQTNLLIDIIPQENPYKLRDGEKFPVKVLFKGKPLAKAALIAWHRNNESTVKRELTTNEKGEAELQIFTYGRWMITTVKTEQNGADQQNYSGSVTWGYLR